MQINVNITLEKGDSFSFTPEQAAENIITALDGDPTNDYCQVTVSMPPEVGDAGTNPDPPIETPVT